MPTLNLNTNVAGVKVDSARALRKLSKAVASSVGKPEQYVLVKLSTDNRMCFSGTEDPCAYGELISIGAIGGDKNKKISAAIAEVVESELAVPPSRFYLNFTDKVRSDFGWNGSTF